MKKNMPKTITLRLSDKAYRAFRGYAEADNRSISNMIETAALRHLEECSFASAAEMDEIRSDKRLMARIHAGSRDARLRRGRFVD